MTQNWIEDFFITWKTKPSRESLTDGCYCFDIQALVLGFTPIFQPSLCCLRPRPLKSIVGSP